MGRAGSAAPIDGCDAMTPADQIGIIQAVIGGIIGVLNAFAVIALIAAGFGIINTLLMSVRERTREIGLMKAMGMGGGRIFTLFSVEAVFIGFLGSVTGALAAMGVGAVANALLAETVIADLEGLEVLVFAPIPMLVVGLLVMGIAFLAGTIPSPARSATEPHHRAQVRVASTDRTAASTQLRSPTMVKSSPNISPRRENGTMS